MKHHGVSNRFFAGTRSDVSDRMHRASTALLASVCLSAAGPLHSKLLVTEVDTHTHTVPLCGARAQDLNGYLKSLRSKRKKHRKSSAKRAREKGRSRKK